MMKKHSKNWKRTKDKSVKKNCCFYEMTTLFSEMCCILSRLISDHFQFSSVQKRDEKCINKLYLLTGLPARASSGRLRRLERGESTGAVGSGKYMLRHKITVNSW